MDLGSFHRNYLLGVVWLGGLRDYPDNFCTPLARILYGRRHLRSRDPALLGVLLGRHCLG